MGAVCCKQPDIDFDGPVDLWHFHLLRSVGKGAFGKVRVVQHKQTKSLYALKYINKQKCVKMRAVDNIIQERRLLEEIDHPFVVNLRYAFQDDENLFMVLDLMLGGDLRFHLDRTGLMKEETVRLYVAEIALALDYLHSRRIVHRDLKPDNILLDERGHAHLTDFNIACFLGRRALTGVAGSMAYMAPEVLHKKGYYTSVDWWSLGVVAYELLFGKRPFRGKTNTQLTSSILRETLEFPENVDDIVSPECQDALRRLIERDPRKRLGCAPDTGLDDIKAHPWFRHFDWDAVEAKEVQPPFVPDSKKANFDATHELEELLLEDNPLKAKKRDPKRDMSTLEPDWAKMEEKFGLYDFTKMRRKSYFRPGGDPATMTTMSASSQNNPPLVAIEDQPVQLTSRPGTPSSVIPPTPSPRADREQVLLAEQEYQRLSREGRSPSPRGPSADGMGVPMERLDEKRYNSSLLPRSSASIRSVADTYRASSSTMRTHETVNTVRYAPASSPPDSVTPMIPPSPTSPEAYAIGRAW